MTIEADKPVSPAFALLIILAGVGSALTLAPLFPALPAISRYFSGVAHGDELVRGLITSVSVAFVVGAPLAGFLVERFDLRKLLIGAAALFSLSGISGLFIDNLWLLLASRVLLGLSETTVSTIVVALIASRLDPVRRDRWLGWFTMSIAVAAFGLLEFGGLVADRNWRFIFIFYAIGFAIMLAAAAAIRPGPREQRRQRQPEAPAGKPVSAGTMAFVSAIPFAVIGIGIAAGAVENTTPIFLPFHLAEIGETEPSRIARVILPNAAALALSAFLYGYIRRYFSIRTTFALSFLGAGLSLIWLGWLENYSLMLVASACLGFSIGTLAPNLYAFAACYGSGDHQARNIGISRGAFFAGAPIMQILLEPVATSASAGLALVTLGGTSLLLMLWPLLSRTRFSGGDSAAQMPRENAAAPG